MRVIQMAVDAARQGPSVSNMRVADIDLTSDLGKADIEHMTRCAEVALPLIQPPTDKTAEEQIEIEMTVAKRFPGNVAVSQQPYITFNGTQILLCNYTNSVVKQRMPTRALF